MAFRAARGAFAEHEVGVTASIPESVLISALAALLAMPMATGASAPERMRPAALEGSSVAWCGEVGDVTADPALFGDSPVYVWDAPSDPVRRWAMKKPGYADIWIDRDNFGWITVGFTEGVEERRAELEREFPDIGVVAVEVENTRRESRKLQGRVGRRLLGSVVPNGSVGSSVPSGVVRLGAAEVTQEVVDILGAEFAGEPLCVDGPGPSEVIQPGPQPTEGDGWTLVGHRRKGGPPWFRTGIATRQAQLGSLWRKARMPADAPLADFVSSVVLWFAEPHGSGRKDQRLDDVVVDRRRSIVHASIVMPGDPLSCSDDLAGANHFFVALDRDRLPREPFWIQSGPADPPRGMPKERTVVEVDLTAPGSVARRGEARFDRAQREPPPWRSGTGVEPGDEARYAFDTSRGIGYLGPIDSIHWVTEEGGVPAPWEQAVDEAGEIVVTMRLRGEPDPHVMATANGLSVRYEPVREAPTACDGRADRSGPAPRRVTDMWRVSTRATYTEA